MIGNYRLIRALGAGAAAEVYLAEHADSGARVALKLLHKHLTVSPDQVRRFRQEAEWVALLEHPNIVRIYEVGEAEGTHFMTTEYVEGESLRTWILSELPIPRVLDIATGVGNALAAAHREWIVHRDIKPENIMLGVDGSIKVLDFGLAKLTQKSGNPHRPLTRPGMVVGTLQYLAPEQLMGSGIDPRTDLFSLGVVLYEMVSGITPFEAPSNRDIVVAILHRDPPPMKRASGTVPPRLDEIVRRALEKDPEDRYPNAVELIDDMQRLRAELS